MKTLDAQVAEQVMGCVAEYPPCPICGQSFGMDHRDPSRPCLDCQCCGDCENNDRCILRGCVNPNATMPGAAWRDRYEKKPAAPATAEERG